MKKTLWDRATTFAQAIGLATCRVEDPDNGVQVHDDHVQAEQHENDEAGRQMPGPPPLFTHRSWPPA